MFCGNELNHESAADESSVAPVTGRMIRSSAKDSECAAMSRLTDHRAFCFFPQSPDSARFFLEHATARFRPIDCESPARETTMGHQLGLSSRENNRNFVSTCMDHRSAQILRDNLGAAGGRNVLRADQENVMVTHSSQPSFNVR
jgi:hypothetical protein